MTFIKEIPVIFYRHDSGKEPVKLWLCELSIDDRKTIGKDIREIQLKWPVDSPVVKPLGNGLWEVRSKLENRISRIIFMFNEGKIVLLHGFIKKTQKIPQKEMNLAIKRSKKIGE